MSQTLKIIKNTMDKKCDLGSCNSTAELCITFGLCGGSANVDVCKGCLAQIVKQGKRFTNEK